jgi:hypothetical protein
MDTATTTRLDDASGNASSDVSGGGDAGSATVTDCAGAGVGRGW